MSYIDTYKSEFRFSAQGRTTRRDFWIYTIGTWLITLAVSLVAGLIYGATGSETLFMGLIIIGCIGLFVLNIASLLSKNHSQLGFWIARQYVVGTKLMIKKWPQVYS